MSEQSLPCLVCGSTLRNVHIEADNQPSNGLAFSTPGHYGSTVFDPMNGEFLEITVCDDCLVTAGERGRVYAGQDRRPVTVDGVMAGWEVVDRPLLPWHKGLPGYDDACVLSEDDLSNLPSTIRLDPPQ